MAGINDYSNTPASNTTINTIDVDEGCNPANINNAIRQLMADIADVDDGVVPLQTPDINGGTIDGATIGGTTPGAGTFTTASATTFSGSGANLTNIPNSALTNSSITINGTSTALGGSINVGDVTGITAGTGISGGGTSGDITINLDLNELTTSVTDGDGDYFAVVDSVGAQKKLTKGNINISGFNNDAGFTTNVGDITGVTAGSGLTGGGTTGDVTLNVGAGTGVTVAADTVSIGQDVATTASPTFQALNLNSSTGFSYMEMGGPSGAYIDMKSPFADDYDARIITSGSDLQLVGATNIPVKLGYGSSIKLATTSTGVDVTGTVTADGISLGDNETINLGASNDLQIYHNGTDSYIDDVGSGDLKIRGSSAVRIEKYTGETMATFNQDSSVNLFYDNSKKFETTSSGIDVTGQVLADKAYIAEATLTDGATINWDMSTQSVAKVTLGGNRTLAAPTNGSTGQFATITVIQDATGSRTLTWNAVYEFKDDTAPTLTTTGSKGDVFVFKYNGSKWLEVGRNQNLTLS